MRTTSCFPMIFLALIQKMWAVSRCQLLWIAVYCMYGYVRLYSKHCTLYKELFSSSLNASITAWTTHMECENSEEYPSQLDDIFICLVLSNQQPEIKCYSVYYQIKHRKAQNHHNCEAGTYEWLVYVLE